MAAAADTTTMQRRTWALIDRYYRDNPQYVAMHQIDSFDAFALRKLVYTVRAGFASR